LNYAMIDRRIGFHYDYFECAICFIRQSLRRELRSDFTEYEKERGEFGFPTSIYAFAEFR